jgi:hypothetical protein
VGTRKGRHIWGANGRAREIDGVRFQSGVGDGEIELPYARNKEAFARLIGHAPAWLLEAKTELNRGLIGQVIVGAHLFHAEFGQVVPDRLVAVVPDGEKEAAIEAFCRDYRVHVGSGKDLKIEVERAAGRINPWKKDTDREKLEMLDGYSRRPDVKGKIYTNVPIGGEAAEDIYDGVSKPAVIDAVRLAVNSRGNGRREGVVSFRGNEEEFARRVRESEVIQLIEIPRTHGKIPRLLNRGVVGRLRVAKYMFEKEHEDITVTHLAALCLRFNDPIAWVCNEKEGITTESPDAPYVPGLKMIRRVSQP